MTGRPVTAQQRNGAPMSREAAAKALDAAGVREEHDDGDLNVGNAERRSLGFGTRTCPYVRTMVDGYATDRPSARHPWYLSQCHRLAAAALLGCITEADYREAQRTLTRRMTELCASGDVRQIGRYELSAAQMYADDRVAVMTDERARSELGDHGHHVDQVKVRSASAVDRREVPRTVAEQAAVLAKAHRVFARWLGDEYDFAALDAVLAALAVERLDGDPLWLLIVSGSGNAKTETVAAAGQVPNVLVVSTISSEGALLSATSKRERAADASGGLLRMIGEFGALVIKDMTSILSMGREMRAQVLAALREVYDGMWVRTVGTDGGRTLEWSGRVAVIGAVTTAWDTHHSVVAAMGDRFVLVRMDSTTGRAAAGRRAIANTGAEAAMRAELADAVGAVVAGVQRGGAGAELVDTERERLLAAADLVTLTRTAVEYDHRGEVVDAHAPEMPTRFAKQLAQLVRGGLAIGMARDAALALAIRAARDSMPPLRLAIIDHLAANPGHGTTDIRKALDKPHTTVDRQLQSLHMLGVITCDEHDGSDLRRRWSYRLAPGVRPDALAMPEIPPDLYVGKAQSEEGGAALGAPTYITGGTSEPAATAAAGRPPAPQCTGCGLPLLHPDSVRRGRCAACGGAR